MKTVALLLLALLALAGCGDDEGTSEQDRSRPEQGATARGPTGAAAPGKDAETKDARGTRVILADSQFGRMLFSVKKQAIYIFERDEENKSNCYGQCAAAWPPVFTGGRPRAGDGVDSSLLGTTKRRDGRRQVTYAGRPLYYYAHEGPGEVECHNVNLNGGLWWVVGPNGKRRP